jgi:hypothetical protein
MPIEKVPAFSEENVPTRLGRLPSYWSDLSVLVYPSLYLGCSRLTLGAWARGFRSHRLEGFCKPGGGREVCKTTKGSRSRLYGVIGQPPRDVKGFGALLATCETVHLRFRKFHRR